MCSGRVGFLELGIMRFPITQQLEDAHVNQIRGK